MSAQDEAPQHGGPGPGGPDAAVPGSGASDQGAEQQRRFERGQLLISEGRRAMAEGHSVMRALSAEVRPARARGAIHQMIWECERISNRRSQFFSQAGQDAFLDERVFGGKRGGVFVEVGGFDGITGSNCLFFELMRGWTGLMVEPASVPRAKAAEFRRCPCLPIAVATGGGEGPFLEIEAGPVQMSGLVEHYDPALKARIEAEPRFEGKVRPARMRSLAQVLDSHHIREVDFISLDVTGSEWSILSAFPFEDYRVHAWSVDSTANGPRIQSLMEARGYKRVEAMGADDIYVSAP
ncbi:MAG: FkbM family methyltransferase [Pseudomonadota bacterium]